MSSGSRHPAAWVPLLGALTTDEVKDLVASPPTAVLIPVGCLEPHGPHLPLSTDMTISEVACMRAARRLVEQNNIDVLMGPSVPYGVTEFADGFKGAIGVPAPILTAFLESIVMKLVGDGFSHVCLVNNHLEPAQDNAVRAAISRAPYGAASVACPLTKRWARTLSDEFKRGDCHAGRYETSLALAAGARVHDGYKDLPKVGVSLSDEIKAGRTRFLQMGLERAYTGAPAEATQSEGDELFDKLAEMIVVEVTEGLAARKSGRTPSGE
jgi:creatinine amidohydrolase